MVLQKTSPEEEIEAQFTADAEVVVSEVLASNRNCALKQAVSTAMAAADRGVEGIKRLYRREPYLGLLAAGACGLVLGLMLTRR